MVKLGGSCEHVVRCGVCRGGKLGWKEQGARMGLGFYNYIQ
jgi:hypothetical protein